MSTPELGELRVERIVPGGRAFVRGADGRPVFVRGALPGDRILPQLVRDKRSFLEVESFELLESGPGQVVPSCAVAERCGGCDLMRLPLEQQHQVKLSILREALTRTGRFSAESLPPIELCAPGPELDYRLRLRLQLRGGRVGFFSAGSHELVEAQECQVASPALRELLQAVRALVARHEGAWESVESLELRVLPGRRPGDGASEKSVFVALRAGARSNAALERALRELGNLAVVRSSGSQRGQPMAEDAQLWVTDDVFVLSPVGGFSQVHPTVNRGLVQMVLTEAAASQARTFLDLYSGSGNFSLPLAHAGLTGHGVELNAEATRAAQRGAQLQGLSRVTFAAADVAREAGRRASGAERYDLVIVDPPRAGAREAASALPLLTAKTLVMVSCDPVTLARDLRVLVDAGMTLERLQAWDMFPQTHHVETVAVLRAGGEPGLALASPHGR